MQLRPTFSSWKCLHGPYLVLYLCCVIPQALFTMFCFLSENTSLLCCFSTPNVHCFPCVFVVTFSCKMPGKRVVKNGSRGPHQTHMNKVKFDPYRYKLDDQRLPASVLATMTSLCCRRCCDILQWKVDYGKYAQLQRCRKCNVCSLSTITHAYHRICQSCAAELRRCAKCQKSPGAPCGAIGVEDSDECMRGDTVEEIEEGAGGCVSGPRFGEVVEMAPLTQRAGSIYTFVDEEDSDEELKPLRGLDVPQLKAQKRVSVRQQERDRLSRLKERERRTVLRRSRRGAERASDGDRSECSAEEL
uniref:Uncharacterized protein TCIL3000_4_3220 n=1 Tax=Trypanosoma congolense (strain IL3000) TaxID=1068625 RepID=G0ULH2_TRYCI|nr:unnamed protein product [Trypanosoma congolense IL3000]